MYEKFNYTRHRFLCTKAFAIEILSVTILGFSGTPSCQTKHADMISNEGKMPSLGSASGWLNSSPLTLDDLKGKVVLVNFCTYTCINWLRSLPYVKAWEEKYKSQVLIVIGVHTPEPGFKE